jgi:hypothetical protein
LGSSPSLTLKDAHALVSSNENGGKVSINNQWKLPIDKCVCDTELLRQMARCFECSESEGLSSLHDLNRYGSILFLSLSYILQSFPQADRTPSSHPFSTQV